jgi:predicted site-specific integrase-resolvase
MNDLDRYISPFKVRQKFDITSNTLRLWAEAGKIRCLRIGSDGKGKRIYHIDDINKIFGISENISIKKSRKVICYARVSSNHQKEDLNRQLQTLQEHFPQADIIQDICSGLNFRRKGLETLLERVCSNTCSKVVVTYKDRLCRFGIELLEWIFKKHNVEFLVLHKNYEIEGSSTELAEDLLSITNFFVAKNNGIRSAKYRRERKEKKEKEDKDEEE